MSFPDFTYMRWAKHDGRRTGFCLAESGLPCPDASLLPLGREDFDLHPLPHDDPGMLGDLLAQRDRVEPRCVLLTAGASHGLYLVAGALLEPGERVLVESPGYPALDLVARSFGAALLPLPRRFEARYKIDRAEFRRLLGSGTRLVMLTNLHNPSGVRLELNELTELADDAARAGATLVVDEVYREFEAHLPTAFHAGPNVIAISSFTKAFGLGSLRAGWIYAAPATRERLQSFENLIVVNPPVPSVRVLAAALRNESFLEACRREAREVRLKRLIGLVEGCAPLEWIPPAGGLVGFPRLKGVPDSGPLAAFLADKFEVQVVPGHFFGAPAHFRIGCAGLLQHLEPALERFREGLQAWRERQPS
ncbi:MAG: pyridoxal phosphate-dependent aminotransferase [Planctomycetota bacterium]